MTQTVIDTPKPTIPMTVIFSCFLAGCLEMYDFVIFGFMAPIIHKYYLAFLDESTGIIVAYLLFAVGFLFRPIGSLIFGHIGDRYGRKKSLVLSVTLMGLGSLGLCLLPTYQDIGILACVLIVLIRIIQGISVGGEYSGAAIYAIEHTNKRNIGLIGSTVLAGTTLGVLLATFISGWLQDPILPAYSWRLAFLLGFGLSIIGYFIRKKLGESPVFASQGHNTQRLPLLYGLNKFKKQFLAAILLSGANNANYYFALVFVPNYFRTNLERDVGFNGLWLAYFMLFLEPVFGWVSDRVGRNKILVFIYLALAGYNIVFLDLLLSYAEHWLGIILIIASAILVAISVSSVNIFVLEIFPVECRYSCGALSYSIGAAVFGGTTPLVCSLIIEQFGNEPKYIGAYIAIVSLLGSAAAYLILNKQKFMAKELTGAEVTK